MFNHQPLVREHSGLSYASKASSCCGSCPTGCLATCCCRQGFYDTLDAEALRSEGITTKAASLFVGRVIWKLWHSSGGCEADGSLWCSYCWKLGPRHALLQCGSVGHPIASPEPASSGHVLLHHATLHDAQPSKAASLKNQNIVFVFLFSDGTVL